MTSETASEKKYTRRDIAALWDGQPYGIHDDGKQREENMAECDRIMIAFHRFQTEGRVAYRRLLGMHGGGGGTNSETFRRILTEKANLDIKTHYGGDFPDNGFWPAPVPNCPPSERVIFDTKDPKPTWCFAYTFCWHAEQEFLLWHRPIMSEFERGLQDYDVKYDKDLPELSDGNDEVIDEDSPDRYNGSDRVAAPYWAWEKWDGLTLPQFLANETYVVKTDKWYKKGYPKGTVFPNPYHRWHAPVSIEDQLQNKFFSTLKDSNTTTRASAFTDPGAEFDNPWTTYSDNPLQDPPMSEVVDYAMSNPDWVKFSTMNCKNGGGNFSIENAHNKLHNHVGGNTKGGIQGAEVQVWQEPPEKTEKKRLFNSKLVSYLCKDEKCQLPKDDNNKDLNYTGTMAQNQSIFDPMFWLHHSNVDRQLMSWQRTFATENVCDISKPSSDLMGRVLYPWTKPDKLYNGELSWNTEAGKENDATFADWWDHSSLPYQYDRYLRPTYKCDAGIVPVMPSKNPTLKLRRLTVFFDVKFYLGGEYALYFKKELVGTISVLSGQGGACGRCATRKKGAVSYEMSETFHEIQDAENAFKAGELCLTRNHRRIDIEDIECSDW